MYLYTIPGNRANLLNYSVTFIIIESLVVMYYVNTLRIPSALKVVTGNLPSKLSRTLKHNLYNYPRCIGFPDSKIFYINFLDRMISGMTDKLWHNYSRRAQ